MSLKKVLLTISCVSFAILSNAQNARVQVIHNCPDAIADSVDVYINGTKALDNFAFRTATPFINLPGNVPLNVGIAPKNSNVVSDTIYNLSAVLDPSKKYIVVASGIVSATGYTPAPAFDLKIYDMARETAANSTNTDLLVMHGATDAPTVDVRSGINTLIDNISYPQFSNSYLELPTNDYTIRITTATGAQTVQTYAAPLSTLGLQGQSAVVLASGFLNPSLNSNGAAFGLYVALPSGGSLIPLPIEAPEKLARLQVIHNCADAIADSVDVYVNGAKLLDNFAFRTATGFIDVPADVLLEIGVAPKNSSMVSDTVYNLSAILDSAKTYIAIANGIVSNAGYTPSQPFRLSVYNMAREEAANNSNTDILVLHGSTDAPIVDVRSGSSILVDDIAFGQYSNGYLSLPTSNYTIDITDASGATTVQSYSAPLQTLGLQGAALTVLASGFLNPSNNSNGASFGLYAALSSGGALIPLPIATNINDKTNRLDNVRIYPNPAQNVLHIEGVASKSQISILDINGRVLIQTALDTKNNVDISHLSTGIYVIKVSHEDKETSLKFLRQ